MPAAQPMLDAFGAPWESLVVPIGTGQVLLGRIRSSALGPAPHITAEKGESFGLIYQIGHLEAHDVWVNGRHHPIDAVARGTMTIIDLSDDVHARLAPRYDSLNVQIPVGALKTLAELSDAAPVTALNMAEPWWQARDPVVTSLEPALLHALAEPAESNPFVHERVVLALIAHLAARYGGMRSRSRAITPGGLAPWQVRRAQALIGDDLGQTLSLAAIAARCSVSPSHFSRAFKASTGLSPTAWLQRRRVEKARDLLRRGDLPLAEVALACGFSDQSHFSRLFARETGSAPGSWRRAHRRGG
jgi:AraC family transcriptional regulator